METNETENIDSTNEEEVLEEVEETTEEVVEEADERDSRIEALEKENKTLKIQKAKNREKSAETQEPKGDLAGTDVYALVNANVAEEDVAEVTDYAKFKGISVKEALQSPTVKALIKQNEEFRKTAEATHTDSNRRSPSQKTGESLLASAQQGNMPESDADFAKLAEARFKK
jgi:hypothetical protein